MTCPNFAVRYLEKIIAICLFFGSLKALSMSNQEPTNCTIIFFGCRNNLRYGKLFHAKK